MRDVHTYIVCRLMVVRHLLHYYNAKSVFYEGFVFHKDPTSLGGPTFFISYPTWCQ